MLKFEMSALVSDHHIAHRRQRGAFSPLLKALPALLLFSAQAAWAAPYAYITNFGSNNVSVIDLATNLVVGTPIGVGANPIGVAFNPAGTRLYVGNLSSKNVSVIDTTTNRVVATVAVGDLPYGLAVNPTGTKVYVANFNDNTVSIIDTATNIATSFAVPNGPVGLGISPDGSRLYVSKQNANSVAVFDTANNTQIGGDITVDSTPQGLAINTLGTRVYVANQGSNSVSVIDTTNSIVSANIPVGTNPFALALSPDGTRLYVGNATAGSVSVIATANNTVVETIGGVGNSPRGISVSPDGSTVYVALRNDNAVRRIMTATNTLEPALINVGSRPFAFGNFIKPEPAAVVQTQTLNFTAPAGVLAPGATAVLTPTASSGLGINVTTQTPDVCTVSGLELKVVGLGVCTLTAGQAGNVTFQPASAQISFAVGFRTADVRTYVPAAAAGSGNGNGFFSAIRVVNPGLQPTGINVAVLDAATGVAGPQRTLPVIVQPGGAVTFNAAEIEAALALPTPLSAAVRPRIRVTAVQAAPIEVQSFLRNPTGVFNEVSGAQSAASGVPINIRLFVPSSSPSYVSTLRLINTGDVPTPVTVARIDLATGAVGSPGTLLANLPAGAAVSLSAGQVEAALGQALSPADRPRLQIRAASASLSVQNFLSQPANGFAEVSAAQTGTSVLVRSYYPSNFEPANPARPVSFVRIINAGSGASPVFATLIDNTTGQTLVTGVLTSSLLAGAVVTHTSGQIEAALNYRPIAGVNTRLLLASTGGVPLEVQSYLAQPNGWFTNVSNAVVGTNPVVKLHVPQIDAPTGYASLIRITNTGAAAAEVRANLVDDVTGTTNGQSQVLIASLAAGATQTVTGAQLESIFGIGLGSASTRRINAGSRPRVALSSSQVLDVQSLLVNPAGVMTDLN